MNFPTVRLEGSLLSAEILDQIAQGEAPGQCAGDFGLDKGRRLTDEIHRAWSDARAFWDTFQRLLARLPEDAPATSDTRERWLIPLLRVLGYELSYQPRASLVGGQTFAISHRAGKDEASPPVHIVGCRQLLDRRSPTGRPRLSPHALVQEYLNRTEHLWGIVTNGYRLRLLRESLHTARPTYVEFDLQQMMEGEHLADFALLFRLLHRSRLPRSAEDGKDCLLERYHLVAEEQGGRIRERLRDSVKQALVVLGNGFLRHPKNEALRHALREGLLTPQNLYRELLYLIYRLLFLLVVEERELLTPDRVYREHYSITRLRRLAEARHQAPGRHGDLWLGLGITFKLLARENLGRTLDLPPLNGELFSSLMTEHLERAQLANSDLLTALRHLSLYRDEDTDSLRRVNYAALNVEELGSVYESLLDFHPVVREEGGRLQFELVPGMERKSTGSYYTRPELVQELVNSALEPVLEERLAEAKRLANSEWRTVPVEVRRRFIDEVLPRLSGFDSVAKGYAHREGIIRTDAELSPERTLRPNQPDPSSSGLDSREHRRGLGEALHGGIHPVSTTGQRQPDRAGNASPSERGSWLMCPGADPSASGGAEDTRKTAAPTGTQPLSEGELSSIWSHAPFAVRYSLLAEQAILSIKVCDPASGSGHFLLAAARRLGKELARVRTGESEPAPEAFREAVRHVIARCIYGVDKNPLAVDLCKVALWIESHTLERPLTFLDHRIKCGDSLVGVFDLEVLGKGIPDDAFKPATADDRGFSRRLRQQNKRERRAWQERELLLPFDIRGDLVSFAEELRQLEKIADDTPEAIRHKVRLYEGIRRGRNWRRDWMAANLWTAAFFCELREENRARIPTTGTLRDFLERGAGAVRGDLLGYAQALAESHRFFHWPLEFPEVFAQGGFDVVLSNPPWERIKLQEREFFASRDPEIAKAPNAAARKRLIQELPQTNPDLWREYKEALHAAESTSRFLRHSGFYPLTGRGDINTYSVFAERMRNLLRPRGRAGIIVPTGIATDDTNKHFFADLVESGALVSLYDFENRKGVFPHVHRSYKFSLLTMQRIVSGELRMEGDKTLTRKRKDRPGAPHSAIRHTPARMQFAFFCTRAEHLRDPRRLFSLSPEDIARINPNTRTLPIFRTRQDAELTRAIYQRVPVLVNERSGENPCGVRFLAMFHMSNDSRLFRTRKELEDQGFRRVGNRFEKEKEVWLPLYEAKMIWHYDHRFGTYEGVTNRRSTHLPNPGLAEHADPAYLVQPWYWVPAEEVEARLGRWTRGWLLGFRRIARSTDERTAIFSLLPRVGAGDNVFLMLPTIGDKPFSIVLLGNLISLAFDWVVRQKLAGVNMNFFYVEQLPVLPPTAYTKADLRFIVPRVLELVYTAWDLKPFADDVWREADPALRAAIRARWEENAADTGGHPFDLPEWADAFPEITPADPSLLHSPFATHHSPHCPFPPFKWDEERRARIRAELDAYYARLYGLTRKQLRYILDPADLTERELEDILDPWEEVDDPLDPEGYAARVKASTFPGETFRVLKAKELRLHGEYRTRRLVLEAWARWG